MATNWATPPTIFACLIIWTRGCFLSPVHSTVAVWSGLWCLLWHYNHSRKSTNTKVFKAHFPAQCFWIFMPSTLVSKVNFGKVPSGAGGFEEGNIEKLTLLVNTFHGKIEFWRSVDKQKSISFCLTGLSRVHAGRPEWRARRLYGQHAYGMHDT